MLSQKAQAELSVLQDIRLRSAMRVGHARKVELGYHLSIWGTGTDIAIQDPDNAVVDRLAAKAAAYYRSLHARFDLAAKERSDG